MNQTPVYTFAKWQVKEGQLHTVLNILKEVAQKSSEEKGNLFYKVHQSHADANTLLLFEGYASNVAVEEHRNSSYFQQLVIGQIVPNLVNREVMLASEVAL